MLWCVKLKVNCESSKKIGHSVEGILQVITLSVVSAFMRFGECCVKGYSPGGISTLQDDVIHIK